LGLSTNPILFATLRAMNKKQVVNKNILISSVTAVSRFTMHALNKS